MGLLSDRQIKSRCIKPLYMLEEREQNKLVPVIAGVTHKADQVQNWVDRGYSRLVVVKDDEHLAKMGWSPMITPFEAEAVSKLNGVGIMSYGVSSYGYDIRMSAEDIKVFTNLSGEIVDPLNMDPKSYTAPIVHVDPYGRKFFIQPPTSVALGHTMEYFKVPRDILISCLGKSTNARAGLSVIVTPLEPEWEGNLVVESVNHSTSPAKVYLEMGIAQLLFNVGDEECDVSYADRKGKYQHQVGTQDSLAS